MYRYLLQQLLIDIDANEPPIDAISRQSLDEGSLSTAHIDNSFDVLFVNQILDLSMSAFPDLHVVVILENVLLYFIVHFINKCSRIPKLI